MHDPHLRLTDEEQRRLEALEAALIADDPRLARKLRSSRRIPLIGVIVGAGPSRGTIGALLVVVGIATVMVAVLSSTAIAIVGCVVALLGGYLLLTCARTVRACRRFDRWFQPRFFSRDTERHPPD